MMMTMSNWSELVNKVVPGPFTPRQTAVANCDGIGQTSVHACIQMRTYTDNESGQNGCEKRRWKKGACVRARACEKERERESTAGAAMG